MVFSLITCCGSSTATASRSPRATPSSAGFDRLFLHGLTGDSNTATFSKGVVIPEFVFVAFQGPSPPSPWR
jgi:Amt family ammonium transporter